MSIKDELDELDRVLLLLFLGIMVFTAMLFVCDMWFMSDSQLFQVIASVLTGFTGAFFGRMEPKDGNSAGNASSAQVVPSAPIVPIVPTVPAAPIAPADPTTR
jgi:uncharacterized membrane protein YjjP (DUF1212 family)